MSIFKLTGVDDNLRETKEYWDKRAIEYPDYILKGHFLDDFLLIKRMDERNFRAIFKYISPLTKVNILECACGVGRYVKEIVDRCSAMGVVLTYTGQDIADLHIEKARELNKQENVKFQMCDMLEFKSEEKFDLIFMVAAMSSIIFKSHEIVEHLKTMLSPNGIIIIFEQELYCVIDREGINK